MRLERLPERGPAIISPEETLVSLDDSPRFRFIFTEEFNPEPARAGLDQLGVIAGACLRLSVEEGISASDVRICCPVFHDPKYLSRRSAGCPWGAKCFLP